MTRELRTFLTFQGGAASGALDHYRDVFDDFELIEIDHYGPDDGGPEGSVKVAKFRLADSEFSCADSPVDHVWGFRPRCRSGSSATTSPNSSDSSIGSPTGARCTCRSTTTDSAPVSAGSATATA